MPGITEIVQISGTLVSHPHNIHSIQRSTKMKVFFLLSADQGEWVLARILPDWGERRWTGFCYQQEIKE